MSLKAELTEEELEFMEHFHDPTSLTENLFPKNFDAPQKWNKNEQCLILRPYQIMMQNFSYHYADDPLLSDVENFKKKKGAGDLYSISARNVGKSLMLMIDAILVMVHSIPQSVIASFDDYHLGKVIEPIASYFDSHKFLDIFKLKNSKKSSVTRRPFTITTENGAKMYGVNEQTGQPGAGTEYQGKHFFYHCFEEFSKSSQEGQQQAVDAENSIGHIFRPSGIPDLCVGSPLGKILINQKLKNWICRLPQAVREDWTEEKEQEKSEEYGGKSTAAFRLNVLAETIEGAYGFYDMARLKEMSVKNGIVKSFEINKENFDKFYEFLIVEKPAGTIKTYIAADIGLGAAPTEIIVVFYDGKKYKYVYNISVFRLVQNEQYKIFEWLYKKFGGAFISIDAQCDGGAIIDDLQDAGINSKHLLKVKFSENLEIGFLKDEEGDVIYDNDGNPLMEKMNTMEFAMKELEKNMYSGELEIPPDPKFLTQFTNVTAKQSKLKTLFASRGPDHLHQSWQVFSILKWFTENNFADAQMIQKRSWGVSV